jgi:hypothetical protein
MSASWDIGFRKKPKLNDLDIFMQSLGFDIEPVGGRSGEFTRVYVLNDKSVPREIEFFYEERADKDNKSFFGKKSKEVIAYGSLKTFSVPETYPDSNERMRIIKKKNVRTQHDYYKHLSPERLKWYETALALKNRYNAIVISEQTGKDINPTKTFPEL